MVMARCRSHGGCVHEGPDPRPGLLPGRGTGSTAGAAVLAAEGLFILAYLIAADAPPSLARPASWLLRQTPLLLAGLIAAGAVLAMDAVHLTASAWITVAGLAAACAAYLVALPPRRPPTARPQTAGPQTSRSSDASSRPGSV